MSASWHDDAVQKWEESIPSFNLNGLAVTSFACPKTALAGTTKSAVDLREGGSFSSRMEAKDGSEGFDFEGTYTRVVPHKLIEYRLGDGRNVEVQFSHAADGVLVRRHLRRSPKTNRRFSAKVGGPSWTNSLGMLKRRQASGDHFMS
jgi:uncharacterized protein YndB with AHSA1/START domain